MRPEYIFGYCIREQHSYRDKTIVGTICIHAYIARKCIRLYDQYIRAHVLNCVRSSLTMLLTDENDCALVVIVIIIIVIMVVGWRWLRRRFCGAPWLCASTVWWQYRQFTRSVQFRESHSSNTKLTNTQAKPSWCCCCCCSTPHTTRAHRHTHKTSNRAADRPSVRPTEADLCASQRSQSVSQPAKQQQQQQ